MFGFTTRLELILAGSVILCLAFIGWSWHERHIGAQKCLQNVEKASAIEESKQATQYTADQGTVSNEGKTYEAAKTAPVAPAPVIRLCPKLPRQTVQGAPSAGPQADGKASGGADDSQGVTVWDTTALVKAGRDADAQITGLQDYILNVCRPK